jgi:hypothetical protein
MNSLINSKLEETALLWMREIDAALAEKGRALHPAEWEIVKETIESLL